MVLLNVTSTVADLLPAELGSRVTVNVRVPFALKSLLAGVELAH